MKNLTNHLIITGVALLFASQAALADMANGTYACSSFGTVPVWDISGDYSGTLSGLSTDFSISEDASGKLLGQGSFSYDDWSGDSLSGSINTVGKVSGSAVNPSVSLEILMSGSGIVSGDDVNFTAVARIKLTIDAADGQLTSTGGSVSVTVTDLTTGRTARRSAPMSNGDTFLLPMESTGDWNLTLDVTPNGTKYTGTATVQTSTGDTLQFTAIGNYSGKTDTSNIKLIGSGSALSLVVSTSGQSMTVKSIKGKMYGQNVSFKAQ